MTWPEDLAGAQALFDRMPEELAGLPAERPDFSGPSTGVLYGQDDDGVAAFVMGTEGALQDPAANLAAMFGMGLTCTDDTYAGTAPESQWGGGPDIPRRGAPDSDEGLWWFACDFADSESTPGAGHALGWVSGDLAWLIVAPDADVSELTVEALTAALP